ncbi:retrograde regulation protein 2, partial [Magnaporthiopsis poae ATCC 64411]
MAALPPAPAAPTPAPGPPASEPESSPAAADIITLENLPLKLAKWDPAATSHLYSLVDMGSNGIRFSISDLAPSRARLLPCLYQERAPISLLDALLEHDPTKAQDDKFPEATILAVARTLARFRAIAVDGYGVPPGNLLVFATEAMRRASNAADMLRAIADAAPGTTVHVLEPRVETLLGAVGARSSFVGVRGLFVDLGGGSLQISYLNSDEPDQVSSADAGPPSYYGIVAARAGQSLPFGAARMTHIIEHESSRVLDAEVSGLQSKLAAAVEHLRRVHPALAADLADDGPGVGLYLYGGGLRGYGSMLMFNDNGDDDDDHAAAAAYPLAGVGSYTVSGRYFAETKKMRKVNKKHKDKIPGLSGRRRHQFPAIATVVEALVAVVPKIRSATFCAGGNREGALMMILPEPVRESNPLHLLSSSRRHDEPPQATVAESLTATLIEALPESLADGPGSATVFSLGLATLFVDSLLWSGASSGEPADNAETASSFLHFTLGRDPGVPGLGHLERAVLAVTL